MYPTVRGGGNRGTCSPFDPRCTPREEIEMAGKQPEIGRDGWTYQALINRHRTPAELHPETGNPEASMRLLSVCTAMRQARTGEEIDDWDVQVCDVRDHVRAVALMRTLGIECPTGVI